MAKPISPGPNRVPDLEGGEDQDLVRALQAGDTHAARCLVERFQGLLFGLCMRMLRHRQDAEDVLQDTFLRALRAISGFDARRPLRPWLLGIAANRCRTVLAKRARRPIAAELADCPAIGRADSTEGDDLGGDLEQALQRLRPEYQLVFVLYHEKGLPYEEIGAAIRRPIGTVKTWLHRARSQLARHLARQGYCP